MPFKGGDVVLVLFPDSNLQTAKRRPALIVQADVPGSAAFCVPPSPTELNTVDHGYVT